MNESQFGSLQTETPTQTRSIPRFNLQVPMSFYRPPPQFDPSSPEAKKYDNSNIDLDNIDYNDPNSFFKAIGWGKPGTAPIPPAISPAAVKSEARQRAEQIWKNWRFLKEILERHEATIQKRWKKKTKESRRKILLSAWPNMPVTHRPDFEAFTRESREQRAAGTRFKDAFMWPYINQEDMCKPRTLLLLLNARGRNPPDAFAIADKNAAHLGYASYALTPAFLNQHTMMFVGRRDPEKYGELIAWADHPDAFRWLASRRGHHPGLGLHILEIQERLWSFLVECCKQILHDIPAESFTDEKYQIEPEPPSVSEYETGIASLAVLAAEAPYRAPASLDITRLKSLLSAKLTATEDHIWALREDPGYFSDTVIAHKEHRQEVIPDTKGQSHPTLKPGPQTAFWTRVLSEVIGNSYLHLETWNDLHEQIINLEALQKEYEAKISIEKDLPEEYLNALLKFKFYTEQAINSPIAVLKQSVFASPEMRPFFVRAPQQPGTTQMQVIGKPVSSPDKIRQRLLWLFSTLWDDRQRLLCGVETLVDEIERLMQSEPKAQELISPYIASVLADLSVLTECLRQIKIYQPWAETFDDSMLDKEEGIKQEFIARTNPRAEFLGVLEGTSIASFGIPQDKKFFYPVDKRRTKENTEAMRAAEKNLDLFWQKVDRHMTGKSKHELEHTNVWRMLSQPRTLQRTLEWTEPDTRNQQPQANEEIGAFLKPLSEVYFDLEHRTKTSIEPGQVPQKKTKEKTRAEARPPNEPAAEQVPDRQTPDKQPLFTVDRRAYKVFSTLFYKPAASSQPGEILWLDFCYAMSSVGFAAEKLYGSVWHFKPTKLDVETSIHFHEPHPTGKLPFRTARQYGRRLNRSYGWHGEMFLLS